MSQSKCRVAFGSEDFQGASCASRLMMVGPYASRQMTVGPYAHKCTSCPCKSTLFSIFVYIDKKQHVWYEAEDEALRRVKLEISVENSAIKTLGSFMARKLDMGETLSDICSARIAVDVLLDFLRNHMIKLHYSNRNYQQFHPISWKESGPVSSKPSILPKNYYGLSFLESTRGKCH
jgi:hypothetical protein